MNLARVVLVGDAHSAVSAEIPPSSLMILAFPGLKARFHKTPAAASWTSCKRNVFSFKKDLIDSIPFCMFLLSASDEIAIACSPNKPKFCLRA
jgi:hypothetical protein